MVCPDPELILRAIFLKLKSYTVLIVFITRDVACNLHVARIFVSCVPALNQSLAYSLQFNSPSLRNSAFTDCEEVCSRNRRKDLIFLFGLVVCDRLNTK